MPDSGTDVRVIRSLFEDGETEIIQRGIYHDVNNLFVAAYCAIDLALAVDITIHEMREDLVALRSILGQCEELIARLRKPFHEDEDGEHCCIHEAVTVVFRMLSRMKRPGIMLCFEPDPQLPMIRGSSIRLRRILLNLCLNAIEAVDMEGVVTVRTGKTTCPNTNLPAVSMEVSDNGRGFSFPVHACLDEFVAGTNKRGDHGIGLAVVREETRLLGGAVRVDSTPGRGTRFTVLLRPAYGSRS